MKPKFWKIFDMCVENGVSIGVNRAFKHTDTPDIEAIKENVSREIMNELYEWYDFPPIEVEDYGD